MKRSKKILLIVSLIIAAVVINVLLGWLFLLSAPGKLLLGLFGWYDYIARTKIQPKAEAYIAETYPDRDFVLGKAYAGFKNPGYWVDVTSPSSEDTYFQLHYDQDSLEFLEDTYEDVVLSGYNTRRRIVEEYDAIVENALKSIEGFYFSGGDFCHYRENGTSSYYSPDGLDNSTLVLDYDYDVAAMGSQYGTLELWVILPAEEVNFEGAYNLLLEIDRRLAAQGIGYAWLEVKLRDAKYSSTVDFHIYDIQPEDLHREDTWEHLQEIWDAQEKQRQEVKAKYESND